MTEREAGKSPAKFGRYDRQIRFRGIGEEGQRRLSQSRVLVVGLGALGSTSAEMLARAGVGCLRLVDRDWLELSNLQRQSLYGEAEVREQLPKAIAAARRLGEINSEVQYEPFVVDITPGNIGQLVEKVDLIVDATDNFETRFLLNDVSLARSIPWVYGGCLGAEGQTMTIVPGESACLRCLMPEGPPAPSEMPTCDTAGIIAPIIHLISAVQVSEGLKLLSGNRTAVSRLLQCFSLWDQRHRQIDISRLRESSGCPACHNSQYEWLSGNRGSQTAVLCGRNAVQIRPTISQPISLEEVARRWNGVGEVALNRYFVKLRLADFLLTLFPDGRAIIEGTTDLVIAKRVYTQYVGT